MNRPSSYPTDCYEAIKELARRVESYKKNGLDEEAFAWAAITAEVKRLMGDIEIFKDHP